MALHEWSGLSIKAAKYFSHCSSSKVQVGKFYSRLNDAKAIVPTAQGVVSACFDPPPLHHIKINVDVALRVILAYWVRLHVTRGAMF